MFGVMYKVLTILGPFIIRTIIIYKLGNEYLGLSSLFTSVLSILNISELGIGSAISFCLYKPVAEDDRDTVRALLSLLRKLYKAIGGVILIIGLALIPFLPKLISGTYPDEINLYILYLIYLLNASSSYLGFAYKGTLFTVYQRGDILHKIQAIAEIIKYTMQVLILLIFADYYWYAIMLLVCTVIITISTELASRKYFSDIQPRGEVSRDVKQTVKSKVMYLSAHSIAAKLTNSVDNIVISGTLGLAAIGQYGNYSYISTAVLGILLIAYQALTPAIGNSICSDDKADNEKLFDGLHFLCFWVITFCSTALVCLFQPFMRIWVGERNMLNFSVVIMVTLFFYSNATRQLLTTYVSATGLWNKTLARQIMAAVINLILDLILVRPFGISGIVFASFFTNAFVALPMDIFVMYKHILHKGPIEGIKKEIIHFLSAMGVCTFTYWICSLVKHNNMLSFLVKIVLCVILPNIIILLLSFNTKDFKYIKHHLKSMFHK